MMEAGFIQPLLRWSRRVTQQRRQALDRVCLRMEQWLRPPATQPSAGQIGAIDGFSIFRHAVAIKGWAFSPTLRISELEIRALDGVRHPFCPEWLPSADVALRFGPAGWRCRFDIVAELGKHAGATCGGSLWAKLETGQSVLVAKLGEPVHWPAGAMFEEFLTMVRAIKAPRVLEIGSRARSGVTRKHHLPHDSQYVGCDIISGRNVDLVCDAHELSAAMPGAQFDAVMALSVLEHLVMPWKMVIELNQVMATGGIGLFTTHQCWPMHDEPWDFYRFSDRAWSGLLNPATGFEIIAARMGEPAYVVAANCHKATNFGPRIAGYLASNVLFRKVGPTTLQWPVSAASIARDAYPA